MLLSFDPGKAVKPMSAIGQSGHSDFIRSLHQRAAALLNGTDRPSALAVFRLITISYFVAA